MGERKLYKTKLCVLHQRGRCSRQYCNFAHGSAELRRSFNGRQDPREGRDLRERLDRRRSPSSNSLERGDSRAVHSSRGDSPRSGGRRMDRDSRKRKQFDGHSDHSGRLSDGNDDQTKDRRQTSSDAKMRVIEQLREMESEIKILESKKRQLEIYLEDKSKDADILMIEIHKLEMQLSKEKEENKRMTTKIKKFIKAHNRHLRLQDELKRSQAQFQKLAEQLELDAAGPVIDDEPKINSFADNASGGRAVSPLNEGQMNSSPLRRRARIHLNSYDASNQVDERIESGRHRLENISRQTGNRDQLTDNRRQDSDYDAYNGNHDENSRRESEAPDIASSGKYKVYDTVALPPTGIAAHAVDEEIEAVESDSKLPIGDTPAEAEMEATLKVVAFAPPLPPPVPENAYTQYKGEDETVDIDGVDEDMVEVDIV